MRIIFVPIQNLFTAEDAKDAEEGQSIVDKKLLPSLPTGFTLPHAKAVIINASLLLLWLFSSASFASSAVNAFDHLFNQY